MEQDNVDETHEVSNSNEMIDKFTLEILMNKNHYKRYIANADPAKHEELIKHNALIAKYKYKITNLTNDLLADPTKQITTDVNDAFTGYVKTLIQYFQVKEIENKSNEHSDEEDILFGDIEEDACKSLESEQIQPTMKSFWGGNRVIKQKSRIDHFTIPPSI